MDRMSATRMLDALAQDGRVAYRTADLAALFDEHRQGNGRLSTTLRSLVACGTLERVCRGIYAYAPYKGPASYMLESIVLALRPGDVTVISFEKAASIRNLTSQIYPRHLTCMTTGVGGRYQCSFGTIELVHTMTSGTKLRSGCDEVDGWTLPVARRETIIRHMRRCGRDISEFDMLEEAL